jgi:hypothetical protein
MSCFFIHLDPKQRPVETLHTDIGVLELLVGRRVGMCFVVAKRFGLQSFFFPDMEVGAWGQGSSVGQLLIQWTSMYKPYL